MLFLFAGTALQALVALAAPSPLEPLSVPVSDILKRDLSGHAEHPHFDMYRRWLESPVGSHLARDAHAFLEEHPNVVSVECHQGHSDCLLVSRVTLPPIISEELAESAIEKRWLDPEDLFISTHLKTYEVDDRQEGSPTGHEHYLDANMKA